MSYDVKDPKTAWSFLIYHSNNKVKYLLQLVLSEGKKYCTAPDFMPKPEESKSVKKNIYINIYSNGAFTI